MIINQHKVVCFILKTVTLVSCLYLSGCGGSSEGADNSSSSVEPTDWQPAGGNATITYQQDHPFLTLIPNLDINQMAGVSQGRELFVTNWTPTGQGRALFDGLGGIFNAPSCTSCHASAGRVAPYDINGNTTVGVLFRLGDVTGNAHPIWGEQLQPRVIDNALGLLPEGAIKVSSQQDNLGRNKLSFKLTPFNNNEKLGRFHLGARIAPQLLGMGLLDAVAEQTIINLADENDSNADGISGRVHWVFEDGVNKVGRFGWKAINSSLRNQNANAMHQDMGLTTSIFPDGNCTSHQSLCQQTSLSQTPEVSDTSLAAVVDFMTALSVPARRINNQSDFDSGGKLFEKVGCSGCHVPTLTTASNTRFSKLSQQTIYAYTDLLLHDMGEGLDDKVKEKNAESFEWRTPPLWGIGIVAKNTDARFLHDGRAKTLDEAIRWHGGEADTVRQNYENLAEDDRQLLIQFINAI